MEHITIIHSLVIVFAYLLGCIASANIVCKAMELPDPKKQGSNNPGATNVLRIGGKKAAALTLVGDMGKGLIPVLLGHGLGFNTSILALIALAAFIGHTYPIFWKFKGGKGVATLLGVLFGINWILGLTACATWLISARLFNRSSLSALITASLTPLYGWYLYHDTDLTVILLVMSLILFWRHRGNIQNVIRGQEAPISQLLSSSDKQSEKNTT